MSGIAFHPTEGVAAGPGALLSASVTPGRRDPTRGKDEVIDHFAWTPSPGIGYFLGDYNPLLAVRNGFLPLYSRSTEAGGGWWPPPR